MSASNYHESDGAIAKADRTYRTALETQNKAFLTVLLASSYGPMIRACVNSNDARREGLRNRGVDL